MKRFVIVTVALVCFGCMQPDTKPYVKVQAVLTEYSIRDMHSLMDGGLDEWHDSVTFKVQQPERWKGKTLIVFFPSEVDNSPLRAIVGTNYELTIEKELLKSDSSVQIFNGALKGLKEIGGNQPIN